MELLVPAAGPGASEVLRLLRPAASRPADPPPAEPMKQLPKTSQPRKMSAIAAASFSKSAATLEAAAVSVFGASSEQLMSTAKKSLKATEGLLGLSCTISAFGEVGVF
jgi:hypothetical protein